MSPIDFMVQVFVPGGPFLMGSTDEDLRASREEKPQRSVTVPDFWVDQTEVTNAQYARCVQAGSCETLPNTTSASRNAYYGNSEFDNYPVVYVSWNMAKAYCAWAGQRLPTEIEWEKAARGTKGDIYPWGNSAPSGVLLNYGGLNGDTTLVGKFLAGVSPYGAFDMAGNVWEWTSLDANTAGPTRGGSFLDDATNVRAAARGSLGQSPLVGFRCVK
jgi:serine/threonine-protein kinase